MLLFTISDEIKPQTVAATITEHPAVHCMKVISAPSAKSTIRPATRNVVVDYSQWVQLVAAMLRGGFTPEEAGKIAGSNYKRIFRAAVG